MTDLIAELRAVAVSLRDCAPQSAYTVALAAGELERLREQTAWLQHHMSFCGREAARAFEEMAAESQAIEEAAKANAAEGNE